MVDGTDVLNNISARTPYRRKAIDPLRLNSHLRLVILPGWLGRRSGLCSPQLGERVVGQIGRVRTAAQASSHLSRSDRVLLQTTILLQREGFAILEPIDWVHISLCTG